MNRQLRLTLVGGVLLLLTAVFAPAQQGKQGVKDPKAPNYYPTEVGNTWHYRVNLKGKDSTVTWTISKHEKVGGETVARLESPSVDANSHVQQTDKGVFQYRTLGADVTPPFKLLAYPIKVGATWSGKFTEGKDEAKYSYEAEIVREEAVEVPAGKFKAVVVQIKLDSPNQKKLSTTYWFVQDVGFVKHTYTLGELPVVLELERFERKK